MRRVLSVVTASVVATAVFALPASADGGWSAPQRAASDQVEPLHVASNGSGDIFAMFSSSSGGGSFTRRSNGAWNPWSEPTGGASGVDEGAVVDGDGNVTVAYPNGYCSGDWEPVWVEDSDFHIAAGFRPYGKDRPYGKEWRQFRLPGQWPGCEENVPALGVDARGTVTAVWSGGGSLHASQRRLGERWSAPVVLGPARMGEFDVVVTPEGIATVVWAATRSIRSATSRTFGRWGTGRKVADIPDRSPLTLPSTSP